MCDTKYCSRCGTTKPASDFHLNKARSSGLCTYCKACSRDYEKTQDRKASRSRNRRERKRWVDFMCDRLQLTGADY